MATMYIREYAYLMTDENGRVIQAGQEPAEAGQAVTFTTTTQSAAFSALTRFVRIEVDAAAFLDFGLNPSAAAADGCPLPANSDQFFGVYPGHKVAAVTQV